MSQFIKRKSEVSVEIKSVWPYRTRRLFHSLNEIPWLSLTALGTLLGVSILFWYFRSIEFFPSDFSVLIGLGVGAAVSASSLLGILTIILFAPAGVYRFYLSEQEEKKFEVIHHFSEKEIAGLQLGGIGVAVSFVAYSEWQDCRIGWIFYSVAATAMLMCWTFIWLRIIFTKGKRTHWFVVSSVAIYIAIASMAISFVVVALMPVFRSVYLNAEVIFFTLWVLAVLINASVAVRLRALQISVAGGFIVAFFLIVLPVATNQKNLFPEMTAIFLGIRERSPVDLRVSAKTCQLILSAVPEGMTGKDVRCGTEEWGKVKVQILSKVGDQWLIEFVAEKEADSSAATKLRVTIPRGDVQVVRLVEERPLPGKLGACKMAKT